ncbi:TetR/AcrR family transcriptional regulator [Verrucomicrobium sp. BvORR106]|uniref:TetR/AcrR family transcriptional regulator n=1 Tax=Verrucomicrobium sp. BvORR106 TaxID=1403819 RepID=UPI00068EC881|nr:TetR/AcrR family transcriptional regulator [Verrucomicrobium sp. BvORR106]
MNADSQLQAADRRTRERERKIEGLLSAAAQEFAAKGYHRTSMEDIARAAEYATGAIYRYFSGKEALFMGLLERQMSGVTRHVQEAVKSAADPHDALRVVVESQIEYASRDITLIQIYFSEGVEVMKEPASQKRLEDLRHRFESWLAARIAAGQKAGEFRPGDPRLFTMVIQGMVVALFRQWASGLLSPKSWKAQARFVSECALRSISRSTPP